MSEVGQEDMSTKNLPSALQKLSLWRERHKGKIVNFISYAINPNHFHFVLEPADDYGVERFMQKFGTGYTLYFNSKHERSGVLFQGTYKSSHMANEHELIDTSVYVNLNAERHSIRGGLATSSWNEYVGNCDFEFCDKRPVMEHFESPIDYELYSRRELQRIVEEKEMVKELYKLLK